MRATMRRAVAVRPFSQGLRAQEEEDIFLTLGDEEPLSLIKEEAKSVAAKEQDIYEEQFKLSLKEFCHEYQIPFLETNLPKSCRQAAKIFYRLAEDGLDAAIDPRYGAVVAHLKSIP